MYMYIHAIFSAYLDVQSFHAASRSDGTKLPLVCLFHGLGSRKDNGLQVLALDLVEMTGVAVLTLDYRCFGGSDGTPRLLIGVICWTVMNVVNSA